MNIESNADESAMSHRADPDTRLVRPIPWILVVVLGLALVTVAIFGTSHDDNADLPVTIVPGQQTKAVWHQHDITRLGADKRQPDHRLRVVDGNFRVTSNAANTSGNRREVWTYNRNYANVDVTTLIGTPSPRLNKYSPQPGLALRTHINSDGSGSAVVIDANVWGRDYSSLYIAVWSWPSTFDRLQIDTATHLRMVVRTQRVISVQREAGDPATDLIALDDQPGHSDAMFAAGDHVDITTARDPSYSQKDAVVQSMYGNIMIVKNPTRTQASPGELEIGKVTFHAPRKSWVSLKGLYPCYIRARIVGDRLQVKTWPAEDPEPGWQANLDLSRFKKLPRSGKVGLVTNHLYGPGQYISFGDTTITPLHTP